jgi:hypothetical protein
VNIIVRTFNEESDKLPTVAQIRECTSLESDMRSLYEYSVDHYALKDKYTEHSFAILSDDMVKSLADFLGGYNKVVELACGEGWLTWWVNKYKPETIEECIDDMSWERHKSHLDIVKRACAVDYVRDHSDVDLYVLSWPYMDMMAFDIWDNMVVGQDLLYIGENWGGCTANDEFFEAVNGCEVDHEIEHHESFRSIHDKIRLFRKR